MGQNEANIYRLYKRLKVRPKGAKFIFYNFVNINAECSANIQGKIHDYYHESLFSFFGAIYRKSYRKNEKSKKMVND